MDLVKSHSALAKVVKCAFDVKVQESLQCSADYSCTAKTGIVL